MRIPKEKYKEILELMPIPCVDMVITYDNKILLTKRINEPAKGQWFLPGGRILKNEILENAVKRKLLEETGLNGKIIRPLMFDETIFEKSSIKGVGTHTINLCFLVEVDSDNVVLDSQCSEYKWVESLDEDLHPYVKRVVQCSKIF